MSSSLRALDSDPESKPCFHLSTVAWAHRDYNTYTTVYPLHSYKMVGAISCTGRQFTKLSASARNGKIYFP